MTQIQKQRVVRFDGNKQIVEVPDPAPAVIGAPTTTDYGGVKLGASIAAAAAATATADTHPVQAMWLVSLLITTTW